MLNMKKTFGLFLLLFTNLALAAGGTTPFYDQDFLPQIADSDLISPNWENLQPLTSQSEVETLVNDMISAAGTNYGSGIGIRSGMSLRKDGVWSTDKILYNSEGENILPLMGNNRTKNNITWYPDYIKGSATANTLNGIRFTSGRFNMGKMPFVGQARLEIPLESIKKEVAGDNVKYWFKADFKPKLDENGNYVEDEDGNIIYTTNLNPNDNYYKVLFVKAPIIDFMGYYDPAATDDENDPNLRGEWKIKFVINNGIKIDISNYSGYENSIHPDLDLEVYSHGFAIQEQTN